MSEARAATGRRTDLVKESQSQKRTKPIIRESIMPDDPAADRFACDPTRPILTGDCMDGQGKCMWPSGDVFEGGWRSGKHHGEGTFTWKSGSAYAGAWEGGLIHGEGRMAYATGVAYSGGWVRGKSEGGGRWAWAVGAAWSGPFAQGAPAKGAAGEWTFPAAWGLPTVRGAGPSPAERKDAGAGFARWRAAAERAAMGAEEECSPGKEVVVAAAAVVKRATSIKTMKGAGRAGSQKTTRPSSRGGRGGCVCGADRMPNMACICGPSREDARNKRRTSGAISLRKNDPRVALRPGTSDRASGRSKGVGAGMLRPATSKQSSFSRAGANKAPPGKKLPPMPQKRGFGGRMMGGLGAIAGSPAAVARRVLGAATPRKTPRKASVDGGGASLATPRSNLLARWGSSARNVFGKSSKSGGDRKSSLSKEQPVSPPPTAASRWAKLAQVVAPQAKKQSAWRNLMGNLGFKSFKFKGFGSGGGGGASSKKIAPAKPAVAS